MSGLLPESPTPKAASGLLRVLGVAFGLAVLVGNTIGMGILRTPGEVASHLPSPALFMGVWLVGGLYALLGALSVAELAALRPRSGGLYPLVHDTLGAYPGFVVGWTDWLATCGSIAAVAMVLGEYSTPLFPAVARAGAAIACLIVVLIALLQIRGVRIGDTVQQATSVIKAAALIALAVSAFIMPLNVPPAEAGPGGALTSASGVALMAAIVVALQSAIYTYDGWTGPIYFSEELQNSSRDIPRAMLGGVLLVIATYILLNAAFLRVVGITAMAGDPFVAATAAQRLFGERGDLLLRLAMMVSLVSSVNALQLIASRVPFAMSVDRLLPRLFATVNRGGTPVPALAVNTTIALAFILTNTFNTVLALLAFMFVANYALTFTSVFVARHRWPDLQRPYRVPGYPFVPAVALIGSVAFMIGAVLNDTTNSITAISLLALSWPVFRLTQG